MKKPKENKKIRPFFSGGSFCDHQNLIFMRERSRKGDLSVGILRAHRSAVVFRNRFGDRKPEPVMRARFVSGFIRAVKAVEEARDLLFADFIGSV